MRCKSFPGNESEQRHFSGRSVSTYTETKRESEKPNSGPRYQQERQGFNPMCMMLELDSPAPTPPQKRPSLGFLLFCQVLPPKLLLCSMGHTHGSKAACHRTQMPGWGRDCFSSIRLFLGKTFRQSKENSPGTAFGPALWLTLSCYVSGSCADLGGLDAAFPEVCLSLLKNICEFTLILCNSCGHLERLGSFLGGCFSH